MVTHFMDELQVEAHWIRIKRAGFNSPPRTVFWQLVLFCSLLEREERERKRARNGGTEGEKEREGEKGEREAGERENGGEKECLQGEKRERYVGERGAEETRKGSETEGDEVRKEKKKKDKFLVGIRKKDFHFFVHGATVVRQMQSRNRGFDSHPCMFFRAFFRDLLLCCSSSEHLFFASERVWGTGTRTQPSEIVQKKKQKKTE